MSKSTNGNKRTEHNTTIEVNVQIFWFQYSSNNNRIALIIIIIIVCDKITIDDFILASLGRQQFSIKQETHSFQIRKGMRPLNTKPIGY